MRSEAVVKPGDRALGLDSLRGCAVIAVLMFHYLNNTSVLRTPGLESLQQATSHLFFGVDLFFVLSGFFIGSSLMRTRGRPGWLAAYGVHRAGRILPLYYLWLLIFMAFWALDAATRWGGAFPWIMDGGAIPLWSYFMFVQNLEGARHGGWGPAWLGITWTLAVEMHFYLLAAAVVALTPIRWVGLVSIAIILGAAALKHWGIAFLNGHALMTLTPARLDSPFAGVLCAWLWRFAAVAGFLTRNRNWTKPAAAALMAAHILSVSFGWFSFPTSTLTINAIVFGLAVLAYAAPARVGAGLAVRVLRWCGVRCYGLYLFHVGILGLVSHAIFNWPPNVFPPGVGWPAVAVAALATVALAAASWSFLERPCIERAAAYARLLQAAGRDGAMPEREARSQKA